MKFAIPDKITSHPLYYFFAFIIVIATPLVLCGWSKDTFATYVIMMIHTISYYIKKRFGDDSPGMKKA
jgi:hypothetical protein